MQPVARHELAKTFFTLAPSADRPHASILQRGLASSHAQSKEWLLEKMRRRRGRTISIVMAPRRTTGIRKRRRGRGGRRRR